MLREIVNRLRGQVHIRVESAFPERVLNLCAARDLSFWDVTWASPTAFTCRLTRRDYHRLRRAAKNLDAELSVVGKEGAPYFLFRFRRRPYLLFGLMACFLGLFLSSFFIWDFVIEGNETVREEEILRALEKNGVSLGTFGLTLDAEQLRNHILLEIPELSWITVNVSGCRAEVQVRERIPVPESRESREPANVVARRAGLILRVQALDGVASVTKGTSVTEGQLLISGVEDTDTVGARVLAGMGSVTARTWHTLTVNMPLEAPEKRYTGEEKTTLALVFGTHRINFFSNSSIEGAEYDKIVERLPLSLPGLVLPVTLVRETYRFYETSPASIDPAAAERLAESYLTADLHMAVDPYGAVVSALCSSTERDGVLRVTLMAECEEEIGERVPIFTEDFQE